MGFKQLATQLKERLIEEPKLPPQARRQLELDRAGLPEYDAGPEAVAAANIRWLVRSQDCSIFRDGGSARDFMEADEIFHRTLAEGAGKGKAWRTVVEMKAQMDRVRFLSSMKFPVDRLIDQHREVVEGIATGDMARAERSMRLHLQGILTDLPLIKQERPEYFL